MSKLNTTIFRSRYFLGVKAFDLADNIPSRRIMFSRKRKCVIDNIVHTQKKKKRLNEGSKKVLRRTKKKLSIDFLINSKKRKKAQLPVYFYYALSFVLT